MFQILERRVLWQLDRNLIEKTLLVKQKRDENLGTAYHYMRLGSIIWYVVDIVSPHVMDGDR